MRMPVVVAMASMVVGLTLAGCGSGSGSAPPGGGTGASAGASGSGGIAGTGGTFSDAGGLDGQAGLGGSGGAGGVGGDASVDDASAGGTGNAAGAAGSAGSAGSAGTGGSAGADGGDAGMAGAAGASGVGGAGGTLDAGDDGAAGGGNSWPTQCSTCHGSSGNPAPPMDVSTNIDTSAPGVGAHQSHLGPSSWHHEIQCNECHVVPSKPYDPAVPTHMNGADDVIWGPLAQQGTFDKTALTCSSTYCHGGTLDPDLAGTTSNRNPQWITVDGSQAQCGTSCHTLPPGGGHPAATTCEACHNQVISVFTPGNPPTVVWTDPTKHIDGKVDVIGLNCTSCHGDQGTGDPAPPLGTKGETATTEPAVGAHRAHLATSPWHHDVSCTDCHALPTTTQHANGTVDFNWSTLSSAGGAAPAFDMTSVTCSSVYCHGSTLLGANAGGSVARTPVWNQVDGSWDACGTTCHTNPPGGTHPAATACEACHGTVISSYDPANPQATVWADRTLHIDGKVDVAAMDCTSCHGDKATNNPAPPLGTKGESLTTEAAVGAHRQHLGGSTWHRAGQCTDCHAVPTSTTHSNGAVDFAWGTVSSADAASPSFSLSTVTCNGTYCHGTTLLGPNAGGTVNRNPVWTTVNGTWDACGTTCHTNPPGGSHPASNACPTCHTAVISSFVPGNPPTVSWSNPALHIDGKVDVVGLTCTSCHGDTPTNNPAPPLGTHGETQTSQAAVGAHAQHLSSSSWHRAGVCADCHTVPTSTTHSNGATDFSWGAVSTAGGAAPAFNSSTVTCSGTYCHGTTLLGPNAGGTVNRTPVWTTVNGTWDACGTTCHTNPPGGTHPASNACQSCHPAVVSAYNAGNPSATVWADPNLHVDGKVEVTNLTCTSCHGDTPTNNPAPPLGTHGETQTSQAAVGAHAQHLSSSTWHRAGVCTDCHTVPTSTTHSNGTTDFAWGAVSTAGGAVPAFSSSTVTCSGTYCHGTTLLGPNAGGTVDRTPVWTTVNGTWDACGTTCHTNPPGGAHPNNLACPNCHGAVISSYSNTPPTATWANAALHINGSVEVSGLTCTSCHGDSATGQPAPPIGTNGETATNQAAVGAHRQHLGASTWHRDGQCTDCHTVPTSTGHSNGTTDFTWGTVANADGANTTYSTSTNTCTASYCHGSTLLGAKTGGTVARTPQWTTVNGTWDACGTTCHTNPPGGSHPAHTDCRICHQAVVATFDPATNATIWADRTLHINGIVESNKYHDLANWTSPKNQANHHGSNYFLTNQQRDEHNTSCAVCHGADLNGGTVGVSCNNTSCHGGDWRACTFCHGTPPSQNNPPVGVGGETLTNTLAVGRHTAHLTSSTTHVAFACGSCHAIPPAGDVSHAMQYVPSADLSTAGHHGDVVFSAPATGMTFDVNGTQGTPVSARGTCTGACHSNGRGGAPAVTPYWAGGSWNAGSCTSCHGNPPNSGEHWHVGKFTLACTTCHPAANTSTHMNGTADTTAVTSIGSITITQGGACGTNGVTCNGTCHGKSHSNYCW